MPAGLQIRLATRGDDEAIANLIARCPEAAAVTFSYRLSGPVHALLGRFPTTSIHLACDPGGLVAGMVLSDVTPVIVSGTLTRGARVSFLRTDPAFQRRGIASALLRQAESDARALGGAQVFWAHIMDGNRASHATFARAGYRRGASGSFKFVEPKRCASPAPGSRIRIARADDLPWLVSVLNNRYGRYDFWRPFDVTEYREGLERWAASGGTPRLWILAADDDRPLAAALAHSNGHALVSSVAKVSPWLRLVNTVVRLPIVLGMPLRTTTVADLVADPAAPKGAAVAIARHAIREQRDAADFVVLVRHADEPCAEGWQSARGISSAVDVVFKGTVSTARPAYIEPW